SGRVVLGDEDINAARAHQVSTAEIRRTGKKARHEDVSRCVHCDGSPLFILVAAEALAPLVDSGRVVLGDENLSATRDHEIAATKIHRAGKESGDQEVARWIHGEGTSLVDVSAAEALAP